MAEPDDAWDDPATWHKANPGLADGFVSIEEFENLVTDARDRPQERFAFLQYNLNIWQGASREPCSIWASMTKSTTPILI